MIAYSSIPELVSWHLLEALYVTRFLSEGTELIIDVGSGAGIPGVLLGIKLPDCRVQLIESNRRKGIFLEEVARQLNLTNISVFTGRYDHFETTLNAAVTSRALDRMTDEIPRMIEHFRSAEVFLFLLGGTVWRHLKLPSTAQVMGIEKIPLSRERYLVRLRTGRST